MVPYVYDSNVVNGPEHSAMFGNNFLLGGVRFRQIRVSEHDCPSHPPGVNITRCLPQLWNGEEDKEPYAAAAEASRLGMKLACYQVWAFQHGTGMKLVCYQVWAFERNRHETSMLTGMGLSTEHIMSTRGQKAAGQSIRPNGSLSLSQIITATDSYKILVSTMKLQ